jgi:hypothetical protein
MLRAVGVTEPLDLLASQLAFDFDEGAGEALPVVGHRDPLALFGCHAIGGPTDIGCLIAEHGPTLVFADAYELPWLPMYGNQHVEHTAVVTAVSTVGAATSDGYWADTEWGQARPVVTALSCAVLARAMAANPGRHRAVAATIDAAPPVPAAREALRENARRLDASVVRGKAVERFGRAYADRGDDLDGYRRFELGCWVVARSRAAHRRWLDRVRPAPPAGLVEELDRLAAAWQQASTLAHVTRRRAEAGHRTGSAAAEQVATHMQERESAAARRLAREVGLA